MSNPYRSYLPPEILDYIVDLLQDEREALKECCLVSKSWIPRTRKHLFAYIGFHDWRDLRAWGWAFPDSSRSPTHYTHTLTVYPHTIIVVSAREGIWVPVMSRVLLSGLNGGHDKSEIYLLPFYRFSSSFKSLRVVTLATPNSWVFDGIWCLPLLENLTSTAHNISTIECAWWVEKDLRWIMALLAGCPDTLECLDIECRLSQTAWADSIDLSNATKLKQAVFRPKTQYVMWITNALQTITSNHRDLQQIPIYVPSRSTSIGNQETDRQWMDLDRHLVQLWESHAIRTKVIYSAAREEKAVCGYIRGLLPEMTKRGIIELVNSDELYAPQ